MKAPPLRFERSRRAGPLHCAHVTRARPVGRPLLLYFAPCNGPTRCSGTLRRRLWGERPLRRAVPRHCKRMAQGVEPNANTNGIGLAWLLYWPALGGQDGDQFIRQTTSLTAAWARYGCRPRQPHLFGCAAGHLPPIPTRGRDPIRTAVSAPNAVVGRFCSVQGA